MQLTMNLPLAAKSPAANLHGALRGCFDQCHRSRFQPRQPESPIEDKLIGPLRTWLSPEVEIRLQERIDSYRVDFAIIDPAARTKLVVEADGYDIYNNTPLVKIISKNGPKQTITPMRNANGSMDLRARPQWDEWECHVRVRFDEDQFSATDVVNLFARVGAQGGIGEGRPNSRESNGAGLGLFEIVGL